MAKPERELCEWLQENPEVSGLMLALAERMGFVPLRKAARSKGRIRYKRSTRKR